MNKVYKVVWNASLGTWVAVSELAKTKTKTRGNVDQVVSLEQQEQQNGLSLFFNYKSLSLAIFTVFTTTFAFAGYEAGGGNTRTNCTATGAGSGTTVSSGSVAIGSGSGTRTAGEACAAADNSIAIGKGAYVAPAGTSSTAIGQNSEVNALRSVALGDSAKVLSTATQGVAIGSATEARGDQSTAIGNNTISQGNSSVAIGGDDIDKVATAHGTLYNQITGGTISTGTYVATESTGAGSTAIGVQAKSVGVFSTALGMTSSAGGDASVALGVKSSAAGQGALAIGAVSNAQDKGTIAVGINSKSVGENSVAIGSGNTSTSGANTTGNNATAIGSNTSAALNGTAIGSGAKATANGGVAIGAGSIASTAAGVTGFDPGTGAASTQTTNVWKSTQGAVALGDSATNVTRQLTGLAAGTGDSDAVNVAQLKTVTNQTFKLQANGDTASSVKTSDTVQFLDGKNINVTRSGNNITVKTIDNPTFTSVTTGSTKIDNNGLAITGGPSVTGTGINAGSKVITNVADGTAATDAVNKGQLDTVSTQANKAITFTGNARKSGDTKDVDRKLGEAIAISGAASTAGTYSGANVKTVTDQTGSIAIQIADAPNFAGTVTSTGQQVNGNSTITGNSTVNGTSTIGSGANAVTLTGTANGLDVGGKKITNVAAPTVGSDAANKTYVDSLGNTPLGFVGDSGTKATRKLGEDLNIKGGATSLSTNNNIGVVSNGSDSLTLRLAKNIDLGSDGSVTTGNTKVDNNGLAITGGPSVTSTGINAGSKVITNVAAGTVATDAVNKGQLDTV
ncbi:hypothetical protein MMP65_19670, partial [Acinetobacter sp. ANC 3926]|uniref:ESPR-type extended signal peptide-containing protein n=1 Tax=Acinetobacter genomosp. 15BJ TaxID=106651 RepID=UPI0024089239